MDLVTINSVWIGPRLGAIHAACLKSFVKQGHRVVLHVYERPVDVPDGVETSDANALLPSDQIIRHAKTGSPSLFSNFLRYEILSKNMGLYVDCDVFCIKPIEDADYIFGFETAKSINGAVLKLPAGSASLEKLRSIRNTKNFVPPWVSTSRQMHYRWRARLQMPVKIQHMPWGVAGPRAVTWCLKQDGLERHASGIDVFYPVHWDQTSLLVDSDLTIFDISTPRTRLLHLWYEKIKCIDLEQVPATSPLGTIINS